MRRSAAMLATLCLAGVAAASFTSAPATVAPAPDQHHGSPERLRNVAVYGITLGMGFAEADERLRELGFRPHQPPKRRYDAQRYQWGDGVPIVDVVYDRLDGIDRVTGLLLADDIRAPDPAEARRSIIARYGLPTRIDEDRFAQHFFWAAPGGPARPEDLTVSRECLSGISCVAPGVPNDCPARLIYKGTTMSASLNSDTRGGKRRLHVSLRDTAAQFQARYAGRQSLPSRPICPPSIS